MAAAKKSNQDEFEDDPFSPRRNTDLVGHAAAENILLDAWNSERLPHAWLITGPKGIGKATLAYRFARFVLAQSVDFDAGAGQDALFADPEPVASGLAIAGDHPTYLQMSQAAHPGLRVIERSVDDKTKRLRGEIVVGDVRQAIKVFNVTAEGASWRVTIVDSADDMNVNAANALLKTLEEPPARGLLILIAHNPGRLLPTIRSRCRTLALKPLADQEVAAMIAARHPEAEQGAVQALANLADGSLGRAFDLMESGGPALYEDLVGMLKELPNSDVAELHKFADRICRRGNEGAFDTFISLLGWWLTRMIRHGAIGTAVPEIIQGDADVAAKLIARRSLEQWIEVWEKISRLAAQADSLYLDRKQVLFNVFSILEKAARA
jgi:DNA polymerase-3 subunit delta'